MKTLKNFGIALANIDNCPIELTGIKFSKCYTS